MHFLLAADIGTTQIKAAIVDEHGGILDMLGEANHVYYPEAGWSEIDMEELWLTFCGITKALTARNPAAAKEIRGIGITALGEGLWPLNAKRQPVRRAILWNDTRARSIKPENSGQIDRLLIENHVTPLFPASPPMVLRWLKENEPENYHRTEYSVHCGDFLNYRLTGRIATDLTLASTASINVCTGAYYTQLFNLLGIGDKAHTMPQILRSTDIVGYVHDKAAQSTGLPLGTPVIAGALDAAATAFGAGAYRKGDACTVFGTSLCNIAVLEHAQVDHTNTCGSTLCGIVPGSYLRMLSTNCGSAFIDWAKSMFAPDLAFNELERLLFSIRLDNHLLCHPYINGERAPFKDAFARGGFFGLRVSHTRIDLMRAAYEGLILSLMDCYGEIPAVFERAFAAGGGANSNLLCTLMASAIGVPVYRPAQAQLGISGVAAALRYALGYAKALEPPQTQHITFLPDESIAAALRHKYAQYTALRKDMQAYWHSSGCIE